MRIKSVSRHELSRATDESSNNIPRYMLAIVPSLYRAEKPDPKDDSCNSQQRASTTALKIPLRCQQLSIYIVPPSCIPARQRPSHSIAASTFLFFRFSLSIKLLACLVSTFPFAELDHRQCHVRGTKLTCGYSAYRCSSDT